MRPPDLLIVAGLSIVLIDDMYVFPEYDGQKVMIEVKDEGLYLTEWITGKPLPWTDLSQTQLSRMANHLDILYNISLKHNQN
jgi:hypothetical protein